MLSKLDSHSGNTDSVNLHWSNAHRYKVEALNFIAQKIKDNWKPPRVGLLYWDSKLMDTLDTSIEQEERLPTLLSGIGRKNCLVYQFSHTNPVKRQELSLPMQQ